MCGPLDPLERTFGQLSDRRDLQESGKDLRPQQDLRQHVRVGHGVEAVGVRL